MKDGLNCSEEVFVEAWSRARRLNGDDAAQEAAVVTLAKRPTDPAGYLAAVSYRLHQWFFNDGRKFTGPGRKNFARDHREGIVAAAAWSGRGSWDVAAQAISRLTLRRADLRLVKSAMNGAWDGALSALPDFSNVQIQQARRRFFQTLGEDWHVMDGRRRQLRESS